MKSLKLFSFVITATAVFSAHAASPTNALPASKSALEGAQRYQQLIQVMNDGPIQKYAQYFYSGQSAQGKSCLVMIDAGQDSSYIMIQRAEGPIDTSWGLDLGIGYPVLTKISKEKNPSLQTTANSASLKFTTETSIKGEPTLVKKEELSFQKSAPSFAGLSSITLADTSRNNSKDHKTDVRVEKVCQNLTPVLAIDQAKYEKMVAMAMAAVNKDAAQEDQREADVDSTNFECTIASASKVSCDINLITEDNFGSDVLHADFSVQNQDISGVTDTEIEWAH